VIQHSADVRRVARLGNRLSSGIGALLASTRMREGAKGRRGTGGSGARVARLSLRTELPAIGYATGNLGKVVLWSSAELTLLFLMTEVMGIRAGIAGTLLLATLLLDIAIDLFAGRINAAARRRGVPYRRLMLAGAPACAAGFALLYALPLAAPVAPWLAGGALLLFRAGYAFVDVPHNAMLPGIATGSHARGRIAGYRSFFSAVATLGVATLLAPAVAGSVASDQTRQIALLGVAAALVFLSTMAIVAWFDRARNLREVPVPDRPQTADHGIAMLPRLRGQLALLLAIGLIAGLALPMLGRTMLYLGTFVFEDPGLVGPLLAAGTAGQFTGVLLWTLAAQRIEKRSALALAAMLCAVSVLAFVFADPSARLWLAGLGGAATAGVFMLPWAILGDIVDADQERDGERREPQSFAAFLVALKAGAALGALAVGWGLELGGHGRPGADPADLARILQWLAFAPPVVGGILCAALASRIMLTHGSHAATLRSLGSS
jgi:glycoside/pentoside/hexuronide:cation symporter, GPH family